MLTALNPFTCLFNIGKPHDRFRSPFLKSVTWCLPSARPPDFLPGPRQQLLPWKTSASPRFSVKLGLLTSSIRNHCPCLGRRIFSRSLPKDRQSTYSNLHPLQYKRDNKTSGTLRLRNIHKTLFPVSDQAVPWKLTQPWSTSVFRLPAAQLSVQALKTNRKWVFQHCKWERSVLLRISWGVNSPWNTLPEKAATI